jgi:hypothetical protein
MDNENFLKGISLVSNGLVDATKQASYSLALGTGGLGTALVVLERFGIDGVKATIISMSAFFIAARIGKVIDDLVEHISLMAKLERDLKIELIKNKDKRYIYTEDIYELESILYKYRHIIADKSGSGYEDAFVEIEHELADLIDRFKNNKNL